MRELLGRLSTDRWAIAKIAAVIVLVVFLAGMLADVGFYQHLIDVVF